MTTLKDKIMDVISNQEYGVKFDIEKAEDYFEKRERLLDAIIQEIKDYIF